jgi:hypothetical protein
MNVYIVIRKRLTKADFYKIDLILSVFSTFKQAEDYMKVLCVSHKNHRFAIVTREVK